MNRTQRRMLEAVVACIPAAGLSPSPATAQDVSAGSFRAEIFAGSVAENYLRYLQTIGTVKAYPWSSRAFSHREVARLVPRDSAHAWRARFADVSREFRGIRYGLIQPASTLRYNSTFAYGSNDGPVWAGRGLTSALQIGGYASWGPVTLTVAPLTFRAENQAYEILPTERSGPSRFGDALFLGVDRPQRFGDKAYSQADPGQTTLRVDLPVLSFGASTANQTWGPGHELPVILGNNAAGYPHLFAGSSTPLDLFLFKLHGKVVWGELYQSEFSTVSGPNRYLSRAEPGEKRFTTGIVLLVQPRWIPGLELGGTRFFHSIWPRSGIPPSYFTKIFQAFLKKDLSPDRISDPRFQDRGDDRGIADNQLVSGFARWVFPQSGLEIHGEFGRDDHSVDMRDLFQEPDHSRVYALGLRKVLQSRPDVLTAGRLEIMNFNLPQLSRYRGEGEIYVHGLLRQGHTFRGQLLGADVGVGTGAGSVMAVDRFTPTGRWTASWSRVVHRENGDYTLLGVRSPRSMDVSHALGLEVSRFMHGFDITGGATLVYEFNRNFRGDAVNLNALAGVRYILR